VAMFVAVVVVRSMAPAATTLVVIAVAMFVAVVVVAVMVAAVRGLSIRACEH
jgi:hypothetical protein